MKHTFKISEKIPFFLILLLSSIIAIPLLEEMKLEVVPMGLFSLMPVVGVYSATRSKRERIAILAITLPFAITNIIPIFLLRDTMVYNILGYISILLGIFIYTYTIYAILSTILNSKKITGKTICLAISGYLLLGFMWTILYILCLVHDLGSFINYLPKLPDETFNYNDLVYYSFTTLTTLGYGDIIPANNITKNLSVFEAIIGQLYLTVLIALLIGKYLTHSVGEKNVLQDEEKHFEDT